MTPGGWINLILSVGFVLSLFAWCVWRTVQARPSGEASRPENGVAEASNSAAPPKKKG